MTRRVIGVLLLLPLAASLAAQQQPAASVPDLEGGWVRVDVDGSGSFGVARAQQPSTGPSPAPAAVIKAVADGVYIFEYRGYQSMLVVDPAGVVVTDPMNAEASKVYLAEIRRWTSTACACTGGMDGNEARLR
jgi:hypothetical protein